MVSTIKAKLFVLIIIIIIIIYTNICRVYDESER
jgi:hypothetical protein